MNGPYWLISKWPPGRKKETMSKIASMYILQDFFANCFCFTSICNLTLSIQGENYSNHVFNPGIKINFTAWTKSFSLSLTDIQNRQEEGHKTKIKFKCSNHENNKRRAAKSYKFNLKHEKFKCKT